MHSQWVVTRDMILRDIFHSKKESELTQAEQGKLNLLESIRGDLTDMYQGVSMECQTAVSSLDTSWEYSKFERCLAPWQCFGFLNGNRLVVLTSSLKSYITQYSVQPQSSKREGGGPYYSFCEDFLRGLGAIDLSQWREEYLEKMVTK